MKKNYFFAGLLLFSAGILAFQNEGVQLTDSSVVSFKKHAKFSGGGQAGLTGAPGENNCTQCHAGSTLDGSAENDFNITTMALQPVTSYTPGDTYIVSLDLVSDPSRKGFSATALDGTNSMAGTLTGSGLGGTQDFASGGREYVSHTSSSNTNATQVWAWNWTAPATNVGDITFYVAANSANDDGATSGDVIYLSEHVIGSIASIDENQIAAKSFTAGYSVDGHKVIMDFTSLSAGEMFFNLVDMNGKSVYTKTLSTALVGTNKQTVTLPGNVENGMYIATMFVGNKAMSANILVQK